MLDHPLIGLWIFGQFVGAPVDLADEQRSSLVLPAASVRTPHGFDEEFRVGRGHVARRQSPLEIAQDDPGELGKDICVLLKLCDGKTNLSVRQLETGRPAGLLFMIPAAAGSKDVIIAYNNSDGSVDAYLTDKSYKLRVAAHSGDTPHVVPNDKAAAKFKAALSHLAREAAEDLPPTGAAVAGNG